MLFGKEDMILNVKQDRWTDQLVSQHHLFEKLNRSIQQNRFPHFSLLLGRPGNGQLLLALSVAQSILCISDDKPCGSCEACYKVSKLIHPDLHFSFPLNSPKETCQQHYKEWRSAILEKPFMGISQWFSYLEGDSKNANISVTEISNVLNTLSLKPFESKNSVLIVWLPEYLGRDSNRLLKFFEEPPDHVFIILAAENQELILPTVLSRAQIFRMNAIQMDDAIQTLSAKEPSYNQDELVSAWLAGNGNMQQTLNVLENQNNPSVEYLRKLLQSAFTYNAIELTEWVEQFASLNKEEQKNFLQWIQQFLSLVIREKFKLNPDPEFQNNPVLQYANKLSNSLSVSQIEHWDDLLNDALLYLQRNANVKLMMTNFSIKLSHILRKTKPLN